MDGGEIALLITAVGGFLGGVFGAVKSLNSDKVGNVSAVVTAYKDIVNDLQSENERLSTKVKGLEEHEDALMNRVYTLQDALRKAGVHIYGE